MKFRDAVHFTYEISVLRFAIQLSLKPSGNLEILRYTVLSFFEVLRVFDVLSVLKKLRNTFLLR